MRADSGGAGKVFGPGQNLKTSGYVEPAGSEDRAGERSIRRRQGQRLTAERNPPPGIARKRSDRRSAVVAEMSNMPPDETLTPLEVRSCRARERQKTAVIEVAPV